jgi:hypothetical protein
MITRVSTFLDRKTTDGQLIDDRRSRVLLLLCVRRFSIDDIAMALNCCDTTVRSMLARPFRSLYAPPKDHRHAPALEPLNLKMMPRTEFAASSNSAPESPKELARLQEKSARQLGMEVRGWLCTFEASDKDRQRAVEQACFRLDESPLTSDGQYPLEIDRALMELSGVWSPFRSRLEERDFAKAISPWLASWIRFWITDPVVWNQALDLEYAHFGTRTQAA